MTPVVIGLIAVNVAVYLWEQRNPLSVEMRFGMWPNGVHYRDQWYRVVTSAFLHLNFEHILLNMVSLAVIGPPVEAAVGKVRFGLLYMLSMLGGSVGFYLLAPAGDTAVGASGAIFGIMGAYLVLAWLRGWDVRAIAALLAINVVLGFSVPGLAWQAHVGGIVFGGVACGAMMLAPRAARHTSAMGPAQVVQAVASTVGLVSVSVLLLQLPPGHVGA